MTLLRTLSILTAFAALPELDQLAVELAPTLSEWSASLDETEARARTSEAVGTAAQRLQNAWGERLMSGSRPCEPNDELAARMRVFGAAWRDAVQVARVRSERLGRLTSAATVVPLLDDEALSRAQQVRERISAQERAWMEYRAWHGQYAVPSLRGCAQVVTLASPGLGAARPWLELNRPVAVVAVGGAMLCPAGVPADGRVVVIDGAACVGDASCACVAAVVLPGAVLAP